MTFSSGLVFSNLILLSNAALGLILSTLAACWPSTQSVYLDTTRNETGVKKRVNVREKAPLLPIFIKLARKSSHWCFVHFVQFYTATLLWFLFHWGSGMAAAIFLNGNKIRTDKTYSPFSSALYFYLDLPSKVHRTTPALALSNNTLFSKISVFCSWNSVEQWREKCLTRWHIITSLWGKTQTHLNQRACFTETPGMQFNYYKE